MRDSRPLPCSPRATAEIGPINTALNTSRKGGSLNEREGGRKQKKGAVFFFFEVVTGERKKEERTRAGISEQEENIENRKRGKEIEKGGKMTGKL
jgi:hypothetical protein